MIEQEPFGEVDGRPAWAFRLDGGDGVTARLTDFGARLTELHVPTRVLRGHRRAVREPHPGRPVHAARA